MDYFSISSNHIVDVDFCNNINLTVVGTSSEASKYIIKLRSLFSTASPRIMMAVGTELITDPLTYVKSEPVFKPAEILILSTVQKCVVFQLGQMEKEGPLPDCIRDLLLDQTFHLVGINVENNKQFLMARLGVSCKIHDLGKLCAWHLADPGLMSSSWKDLGSCVLNIPSSKFPDTNFKYHKSWCDRYFNQHNIKAAGMAGYVMAKAGEKFLSQYIKK